jgi:uncharacterized protein YceK
MKTIPAARLFILLILCIIILLSGCSSGTYPNMTHNHNKTRTDFYGNKYKFKGIMKQYNKRTYGFEANPF